LNVCLAGIGENAFNEAKLAGQAKVNEIRAASDVQKIMLLSAVDKPLYPPEDLISTADDESIRRLCGLSFKGVEP